MKTPRYEWTAGESVIDLLPGRLNELETQGWEIHSLHGQPIPDYHTFFAFVARREIPAPDAVVEVPLPRCTICARTSQTRTAVLECARCGLNICACCSRQINGLPFHPSCLPKEREAVR